ncbi:glucan 1,4-alpha-glucosidase [Chroococcidiopsis sp. FACHB-1243]|uniref:glycoside hydrolase family 15 protein n=1 Tax=Chroococcidiopsis sp. [FACHB-1243] TaxID=2692781 RepID=UPI00177D3F72|nr:glycoside hydrolase family 15 protein [Chroococcidiopsis sp. [FACHB-1243]]MBD2307733.1 glucan 1,4-alpha-glucosidase [Chroococcidiopsis sp. [FACHB-1243]]
MAQLHEQSKAFGQPGVEPRWTQGNKDGVGTAYSAASRVWFTLSNGILNEVYYPTIDRPQIQDLQYLITDGESFLHEEKRHLYTKTERIAPDVLGYRITNSDPEGRYTITKEIIADPQDSCILQHTKLTGDPDWLAKLRLYVLCAPHLSIGGWNDSAAVVEVAGRKILTAEEGDNWLAMTATVPLTRLSCGYVGVSDGWTDLVDNLQMDWEFPLAEAGNIALTAEIDVQNFQEFTLGLAFGRQLHDTVTTLLLSLDIPFEEKRSLYINQWQSACEHRLPLQEVSGDRGNLYHSSFNLLLAHEDKIYPGALIASLSIPWGEAHSDNQQGGYHLVWPRDMVSSVTALLAAGHKATALEALIYLAASQQADGGFAQNFWINGDPYWTGIQLDQVAFPIMLAWRLYRHKVLRQFDPYPMVMGAAGYLIRHGPATQQERWEEASGYSPSTLASNIAALICAATYARERGDENTALFMEEYADFLESHIEAWTVTTEGTLVPQIKRHYIRINPVDIHNPQPNEDPDRGMLVISNRPPGSQWQFPAKEIVDAGFLELVRYGIRQPDDPVIVDSLKVVDAVLKVETPFGSCWHRYNHDGYGQREDGDSFITGGKGRAWPLLTGERGHYELAAGRDPQPFIQAMEGFASDTGLLPEQIWDEADRPEAYLYLGKPTGSAMPLAWAHAEYIMLLRSARDGQVFEWIPEVAARYQGDRNSHRCLEIWKFNRQVSTVKQGYTLRIQTLVPFRLRWSKDDWQTVNDTDSTATALDIDFVDISIDSKHSSPIHFTFFWIDSQNWESRNYQVAVVS